MYTLGYSDNELYINYDGNYYINNTSDLTNNIIVNSGGNLYINNNLSIPETTTINVNSGGKIKGTFIISRWNIKYHI